MLDEMLNFIFVLIEKQHLVDNRHYNVIHLITNDPKSVWGGVSNPSEVVSDAIFKFQMF